ncbi:MAG: hypothetical protein KBA40_01985 [Candidatus Peribacteraceae bacterium]|nr:hypothetical protein [Candidatus Peribacteraceae bacterium]MBP9850194.1 hypothetical protein [Candidatus Peribacteraceae bacterium]
MTTIIERNGASDETSSASTMLVAVIAIVVILGFALFMFRYLPLDNPSSGGTIDVNVQDVTPTNP